MLFGLILTNLAGCGYARVITKEESRNANDNIKETTPKDTEDPKELLKSIEGKTEYGLL